MTTTWLQGQNFVINFSTTSSTQKDDNAIITFNGANLYEYIFKFAYNGGNQNSGYIPEGSNMISGINQLSFGGGQKTPYIQWAARTGNGVATEGGNLIYKINGSFSDTDTKNKYKINLQQNSPNGSFIYPPNPTLNTTNVTISYVENSSSKYTWTLSNSVNNLITTIQAVESNNQGETTYTYTINNYDAYNMMGFALTASNDANGSDTYAYATNTFIIMVAAGCVYSV